MNMKYKLIALFLLGVFISQYSFARCLDDSAKFAKDICGEFNRSGSNKSTKLDGKLEANAEGLIKKFIGGVEGNVNADAIKEEYSNLLREDMPTDISDTRNCRQKMAQVALDACNNKLNVGEAALQKQIPSNNSSESASNFSLTLRSNVYGDSVYINGKKVGSTRLDLQLPGGRHTVSIKKSGYIPYNKILDLKKDTTIRAKLKRVNKTNSRSTFKKKKLYSATSYCSISNVQGRSYNHYTYQDAKNYAIHDCVQRGGVYSCCAQNTSIVNNNNISTQRYSAEAHCSATGVTGYSHGYTQQGAINSAIQDCINKGGITDCCRVGARIVSP